MNIYSELTLITMVNWTMAVVTVVMIWAMVVDVWPQLSPVAALLQELAMFGQRVKNVVASLGDVLGVAHPFVQSVGEACGRVPPTVDAVNLCTDAIRRMGAAIIPPTCVLATDLLVVILDLWTGLIWVIQQVMFVCSEAPL